MKFAIGTTVRVLPSFRGAEKSYIGAVGVVRGPGIRFDVEVDIPEVGEVAFDENELEAVTEATDATPHAPSATAQILGTLDRHPGEKPIDFYDRAVNLATRGDALVWIGRHGGQTVTGTGSPEHWHTLAHRSAPCGPPRYRGRSVNGIREAVRYSLPFLIRCAAALVVSIVLLVALGVDPAFVAIVLTLALAAILAGHR